MILVARNSVATPWQPFQLNIVLVHGLIIMGTFINNTESYKVHKSPAEDEYGEQG